MTWKCEFLKNASSVFDSKSAKDKIESNGERLYNKIGDMHVYIDFLRKALGEWVQLKKDRKL